MWYRALGSTGAQIPEVGLGTWEYRGGPAALRAGLLAGAWFVDTAEVYGTEPVVREAIRGMRERVFLATKAAPEHLGRRDLRRAAEQSLQRLGTDYLDLYQLHYPNRAIPLEETMGAMEELVDEGRVRFIGVSNFSLRELREARRAMRKHPIVSNQVLYNITDRTIEGDMLPYCQAHRILVIAHTPLGRGPGGFLANDPRGVLSELARATGKTVAQVALNWCLSREGVVVIPRSSSPTHILDNCGASGWRLSPQQVWRLDREIHCRRRGRLGVLARRWIPSSLAGALQRFSSRLPPALRRRFE